MRHSTWELVERFQKSNLTLKDFCTSTKVPLSSLKYHLQKSRLGLSSRQQQNPTFIPLKPVHVYDSFESVIILRGYKPQEIAEFVKKLEH